MLEIVIPESEGYDEASGEFLYVKGQRLQLEHSLVSLAKWESKWHKPFISKDPKTSDEEADYIRCMTITQNVNPLIYRMIPADELQKVREYIENEMTATWFTEDKNGRGKQETITAEIIYYWMISLNIPMQCEKWHLNRLLTLIRVCNTKNTPAEKMSRKATAAQYKALNASRRKKAGSKG